jgi:hypothetical protein
VPLPDGRIVAVGRAEFDALPARQRKRHAVAMFANREVAILEVGLTV